MSVDQRIRTGLLATVAELPEPDTTRALERVVGRGGTTRRGRRAVPAVAAVAAVAAAVAIVVVPRALDDEAPRPAEPAPTVDARTSRVIERGELVSYGADASGQVLTVWSTCGMDMHRDCDVAWRLGAGEEPLATGLVPRSGASAPWVYPASGGYVVQAYNAETGMVVAADGTTAPLARACAGDSWPTGRDPGRYVLASGLIGPYLVDLVSRTSCDTGSFEDARTLTEGEYAEDGTLWGLAADGDVDRFAVVGRYDGRAWTYRELPGTRVPGDNALAVAGPRVAVLRGTDGDAVVGLTTTTDDGATWSDVEAADLPFATYDSLAFAGGSTLLVADGDGRLWRSSDGLAFTRVETPAPVYGLEPAGDAVLARTPSPGAGELVRVSEAGSVEPLPVR